MFPLLPGPPMMAVLPSEDSETERPCCAAPVAPEPTSLLPCWVQTPPLRVNIHAAPMLPLSLSPPTMVVLPLEDSETERPCSAPPIAPVPTSLLPCWDQTLALRVKTHTAPMFPSSANPPTMAVLPSEDRETELPCSATPSSPCRPACCLVGT